MWLFVILVVGFIYIGFDMGGWEEVGVMWRKFYRLVGDVLYLLMVGMIDWELELFLNVYYSM